MQFDNDNVQAIATIVITIVVTIVSFKFYLWYSYKKVITKRWKEVNENS